MKKKKRKLIDKETGRRKPGPEPGNPYKLNESTVNKLEQAFAIGSSISEACFYADISRQTFSNWRKSNPLLFDRFKRLKQKPILKARQTIVNALGKPEHAWRYIERKRPKEFGDKAKLGVDGQIKISWEE